MSVAVVTKTEVPRAARGHGAVRMPGFRDVTQVAVITHNAEQTLRALAAAFGPGSFKVATLKSPELFNTSYAGAPTDGSMKVGLTWIGDMQLEVIEPLADRNVFTDYLRRRGGKAGIQHIYLQRNDAVSYEQALERFAHAGYPATQHGQLNASGRLGFLTVPALPRFLAGRFATRFCYTSSWAALKLDIELAKFPAGVSHRLGLRMARAQQWIPDDGGVHFESAPADAILSNIDAIYVLGRNIDEMVAAYARLTDQPAEIERYSNDMLPGQGRIAHIRLAASEIFLVEPQSGPVHALLAEHGEGIQLLRGRAAGSSTLEALRGRGWVVEPSAKGLFATHAAVPFALLVVAK